MAVKRKAAQQSISDEEAQEIFRRHFEAQFAPLPETQSQAGGASKASTKRSRANEEDEDDGDEDSHGEEGSGDEESDDDGEWNGLSEDDAETGDAAVSASTIEVVDHSSSATPSVTTMTKKELKAFMSSRPPDPSAKPTDPNAPTATSSSSSKQLPEDAPSLLAQDLELRRLISESHLFSRSVNHSPFASSSTTGAAALEPKAFTAGRIRQKATDMRVQALGSKASILKQDNVPMNIRKGMNAAASGRETKRRREARENGVILERVGGAGVSKKQAARERRKDPAVDRPGVGRLRGAELKLSARDIQGIEGGRDTFGRKSRR